MKHNLRKQIALLSGAAFVLVLQGCIHGGPPGLPGLPGLPRPPGLGWETHSVTPSPTLAANSAPAPLPTSETDSHEQFQK
ncbi:MAG TPA: hypothetical protein VK968_03175 [Roseimicrobium sp.]|nr:hypothetical protein [Roseimicrobium sp.]